MEHLKIGFIGGGNMARALVGGLIASGYPKDKITVANRGEEKLIALKNDFGVETSTDNNLVAQNAEVLVLAVKPQVMAEVLTKLVSEIPSFENKLIISLAAGVTTQRLQNLLNGHKKIIRLMPNTPALISQGVTGMFKTNDVTLEEKNFADQVLKAVGQTVWVNKEENINTVTAASGSSPAYFFLFMEYLMEHTQKLGLSKEQARTLVAQTALGAAELVMQKSDVSIEDLRAQVTSKGGTTFAAISKFEELDLRKSVCEAMDACINRAKEMEKLF